MNKAEEKKSGASEPGKESKVVITGDDVLIEYVKRLIHCVKNLLEAEIGKREADSFEKFLTHYVWSSKDRPGKPFWERLQNRYSEMVSRRRKLLKSIVKKELAAEAAPADAEEIERRIGEKEGKK